MCVRVRTPAPVPLLRLHHHHRSITPSRSRSFPLSIQSPIPRVRTAARRRRQEQRRDFTGRLLRVPAAPAASAVAANPDADPGGAHATLGLVAFLIPIWRRERDEIESPAPAREVGARFRRADGYGYMARSLASRLPLLPPNFVQVYPVSATLKPHTWRERELPSLQPCLPPLRLLGSWEGRTEGGAEKLLRPCVCVRARGLDMPSRHNQNPPPSLLPRPFAPPPLPFRLISRCPILS